jgi:hypothetical protein
MLRRPALVLAAFVLGLLALPTQAQQTDSGTGNLAFAFDVDSLTQTYTKLTGQNVSVFGSPMLGSAPITTGGLSTVVTTAVSGTPFAGLAVGDVLIANMADGTRPERVIDVFTSSVQVSVDTVWTLPTTGVTFGWKKFSSGTTVNDGWVPLVAAPAGSVLFWVQYDQGDLTVGLDAQIQCKGNFLGAAPIVVYPGPGATCGFGTLSTDVCRFATAGINSRFIYQLSPQSGFSFCRVGLKVGTAGADTSDAGANRERVTVGVTYVR